MAPEVLSNVFKSRSSPYTRTCDVYSYGGDPHAAAPRRRRCGAAADALCSRAASLGGKEGRGERGQSGGWEGG